jgi:hypothetical protein
MTKNFYILHEYAKAADLLKRLSEISMAYQYEAVGGKFKKRKIKAVNHEPVPVNK